MPGKGGVEEEVDAEVDDEVVQSGPEVVPARARGREIVRDEAGLMASLTLWAFFPGGTGIPNSPKRILA